MHDKIRQNWKVEHHDALMPELTERNNWSADNENNANYWLAKRKLQEIRTWKNTTDITNMAEDEANKIWIKFETNGIQINWCIRLTGQQTVGSITAGSAKLAPAKADNESNTATQRNANTAISRENWQRKRRSQKRPKRKDFWILWMIAKVSTYRET